MTERPILMSTEMVRAILDDRKTQTRRVIKNPQRLEGLMLKGEEGEWCPYGKVGDRLYVREKMYRPARYIAFELKDELSGESERGWEWCGEPVFPEDIYRLNDGQKWRTVSSIHMRKKFARIWLEITGIRVERVQEISEKDAKAEGCHTVPIMKPSEEFAALWHSLNEKRGFGWDKNPWVWVVEFKLAKKEAK